MRGLAPLLSAVALATACTASATRWTPPPGFRPSPHFGEYVLETRLAPDARCVVDLAGDYDPALPDHVVFFALPNGNSIEWTAGCTMTPDLDWHYDIQHIAAQTRYLREFHDEGRNLVLVYLEADGKSWPAWRRKDDGRDALIPELLESAWPVRDDTVWTLTGHSGGGSLTFGYLNAVADIAPRVVRIAFLDSNYAFAAEENHGAKFARWLASDEDNVLAVLAYDDREITYNGKKVVSDTGGTYRATLERMVPAFEAEGLAFESSRDGDWIVMTAADGRADFRIHTNPENEILHTVMVGEMNGLVHAMTLRGGETGAALRRERVYSDFVQSAPYDF